MSPAMLAVSSRAFAPLAAILTGGLALRVAAIAAGPGYPFDVVTFQRWAARMAAGGPPAFYDPALFADYPPGLLYILWPLGLWPGGPPTWAVRAISIPFDLAIAVVLFAVIARLRGSREGLVVAALYSLNPALALGFAISDDTPLLGVPIRLLGVLLLAVAILLIAARLWTLVPRDPRASEFARDLATLLATTTLVALAVYELPTRIHERYLFAVFAVLAPFAGLSKRGTVAYVILSVVLAVSLLFAFTHQEQTGVRAPDLIERTLFDPSVLIFLVLAGLGATAMLAMLWARRVPALLGPDSDSASLAGSLRVQAER